MGAKYGIDDEMLLLFLLLILLFMGGSFTGLKGEY